LNRNLHIQAGETLLIRSGTTSVGLAAAAIAKNQGLTIVATTRQADREKLVRSSGSDHILIDNGSIVQNIKIGLEWVEKALELEEGW
jgi:NADPH2:quinone reductase